MKKILLGLAGLLSFTTTQAQDISDALRYTREDLTGTARFSAMGGAFGALGGDMSAININPAGSAVFLNSTASFTLGQLSVSNSTNYNGTSTSNDESDIHFNQAGGILVVQSTNDNWRKFTFGVNYTKTNNYDDFFVARGNSNTSIDRYFLNYADGVPLDLLEPLENESIADLYQYLGENEGYGAQQALLGYQAYIIDPETEDLSNTRYRSSIAGGNFSQEYSSFATGMNGKFSFNFATQYQDFLYLGANLNTHFINFNRTTRFEERNQNAGSITNEVRFNNFLNTNGDGFSFQLGAIAKVSDNIRLGAGYESPTWYNIREEARQFVESYSNEFDERISVNPGIVNVYPEYSLKTPGKLTASGAVILGATGLISVDYSYSDYSNIEFRPKNDPDFSFQNDRIANSLGSVHSFRVGGETRLNSWSLRAGYRYEGSPFVDDSGMGDLNSYSLGAGYSFGNLRLDLAYVNTQFQENPQLYNVGLTNRANIDRQFDNILLSLTFGL